MRKGSGRGSVILWVLENDEIEKKKNTKDEVEKRRKKEVLMKFDQPKIIYISGLRFIINQTHTHTHIHTDTHTHTHTHTLTLTHIH